MPEGDQFTDWCMQFKADDQVKVWNDKETIPAWVDGTVKYVSKPKSEIRVDYPITAEHPNGAYTIHDLDDGNVQFRDETVDHCEAVEDVPVVDQLNDVLTSVALGQDSMYTTHKVKLDRIVGLVKKARL